jgi:hypothetical protein
MPAKSIKQKRLMSMALAAKKGKGASAKVKKVAKSMTKKSLKDFAKTKEKGLPMKKKAKKKAYYNYE